MEMLLQHSKKQQRRCYPGSLVTPFHLSLKETIK